MRIAILIHSLRAGGAERVAVSLANHWSRHGNDVTVITIEDATCDAYDLDSGVMRVAFDLANESANLLEAAFSNIRRLALIRRALHRVDPDAVIGFMTTANVYIVLATFAQRCVTIGSEHSDPSAWAPSRTWATLRKVLYRRLGAVVALTPSAASWFVAHTSARAAHTIPNPLVWPVTSARPAVPPSRVLPAGRRLVMGCGRLSREKGFDLLLEAFGSVASSRPDWDLAIVGEGPDIEHLRDQTEALGLGGRVYFPGWVGNPTDWYSRADVFVLSSRVEGFGNALVEAMASGTAVVSFDCPSGPREIVAHGVDGLLVPPLDVTELALMMATLMDDSAWREQLAAAAVSVRDRYGIDRIAALWEEAIAQAR